MVSALYPRSGDRLQMVRTRAFVIAEERIAEGGQGVVYRARLEGGAALALKWYRPSRHATAMRSAISNLVIHGRPHDAFAWPLDVVECSDVEGFGYVMPFVPAGFRSLISILAAREQPPFRSLTAIGRELVDAFAALHSGGLCYRDINFGNLLVNPETSEVAIVDNDNIGVDNQEGFVLGTLRFMAPEVLRHEELPSTVTDLYSLSVFLFYLFVHGHPLEGARLERSYNVGEESETKLIFKYFGQEPLFVFDPDDDSNRPVPGDPMLVWWEIYPRFLQDLFVRAFTTGLHDASLAGRITEGVWRRAMVRLGNSVHVCSCTAGVFWDPNNPQKRCWHCGQLPPEPMILEVSRHSVVLSEGATITSHHLVNDRDFRTLVARVERPSEEPDRLVLRNLTSRSWTVHPVGEHPKRVSPGQRLGVRPMKIELGQVRATIVRAEEARR